MQNSTVKYCKLDIMLQEIIPSTFSQDFWLKITAREANQFLMAQAEIMTILLEDYRLFSTFFSKFYNNHSRLNNWYILAHENQMELKKYIFKQLLSKSLKNYREQIRDKQIKIKFQTVGDGLPETNTKEKRRDSFHMMNANSTKINSFNKTRQLSHQTRQESSKKEYQTLELDQRQKQDYHQLFLRTFNACDGSKYIYYNFNKHMKGIQQKKKYNDFIRIKKHRRLHKSMVFREEDEVKPEEIVNKSHCPSAHIEQTSNYFHEKQANIDNSRCSKFLVSPIGSITNQKCQRQQLIFRRMPNLFKKIKLDSEGAKKLQRLRKRKIL